MTVTPETIRKVMAEIGSRSSERKRISSRANLAKAREAIKAKRGRKPGEVSEYARKHRISRAAAWYRLRKAKSIPVSD